MFVTIYLAKVCYGPTPAALTAYLGTHHLPNVFAAGPGARPVVQMNDSQFVRFKNAGKRHASKAPGKTAGAVPRDRASRTASPTLEKWDVAPYGALTGKAGPWGAGAMTNRDHVTAHSSNVMAWKGNLYPIPAADENELKRVAPAITVSGRHHREASWTYGGRTKTIVAAAGVRRVEYGAFSPDDSVWAEMDAMLGWKADPTKHSHGHSTLRLEMVGAYVYLYKTLVGHGVITASKNQDDRLLHYLNMAVHHPDQAPRK